MTLHKEGTRTLIFGFIVLASLCVATYKFTPMPVYYGMLAISIFVYAILLQFFRKPFRKRPEHPGLLIAPADGKVVVIEEVVENEFIKGPCRQISIFMSPFNVHINWFPFDAQIAYYKYHPGLKLVAWHPKASELNERSSVGIVSAQGHKVLLRQVAGALARRIVCYAEQGKTIKQGDEMGFIKFGSRVDIYLPLSSKIKVTMDQKVTGRETVIAEL